MRIREELALSSEADSSGVYICKSVVNVLIHGNYICKSEENYLSSGIGLNLIENDFGISIAPRYGPGRVVIVCLLLIYELISISSSTST